MNVDELRTALRAAADALPGDPPGAYTAVPRRRRHHRRVRAAALLAAAVVVIAVGVGALLARNTDTSRRVLTAPQGPSGSGQPGPPVPLSASQIVADRRTASPGGRPTGPAGLIVVDTNNGHITPLVPRSSAPAQAPQGTVDPALSPDRAQVAFVEADNQDVGGRIAVMTTNGTDLHHITDGPSDTSPSWSPDGAHVVYVRNTNPLGPEPAASAVIVARSDGSDARTYPNPVHPMSVRWSPNGTQLTIQALTASSPDQPEVGIFLVDLSSNAARPLSRDQIERSGPAWSPDSTRLAFSSRSQRSQNEVAILDLSTGQTRQVTTCVYEPTSPCPQDLRPSWSPDGRRLAFVRHTGTSTQLAVIGTDGTGSRIVTSGPFSYDDPDWGASLTCWRPTVSRQLTDGSTAM